VNWSAITRFLEKYLGQKEDDTKQTDRSQEIWMGTPADLSLAYYRNMWADFTISLSSKIAVVTEQS
jgi:hypothetical protein